MVEQHFITFYNINKRRAYRRLIVPADCSPPPLCLSHYLFFPFNRFISLWHSPVLIELMLCSSDSLRLLLHISGIWLMIHCKCNQCLHGDKEYPSLCVLSATDAVGVETRKLLVIVKENKRCPGAAWSG